MIDLTAEELAELKGQGFLLMKNKEEFALRIVYPAGIATSVMLRNTADLADKYGKGLTAITVRLNAEIVGIPYENIAPMKQDMDKLGLIYGGTGAKVRPIVCCKGTVCKFGLIDTQALCQELHNKYFGVRLPHKFKINITGCPNNCAKVQLNDLAFMGAPNNKLRVFIGGRCGRKTIMGEEICKIPMEKASEATDICISFYNAHGKAKQRFGVMIEEMREEKEYLEFIDKLKALE